jgi:prophage antirepressor-like protein
MLQSLCFNDFTFSPVTRDNQPWFRSSELARALGYSDDRKVSRLYDRNSDEFTPEMTQLVEIVDVPEMGTTGNLLTKTRIFSLRGCHLLAMFARTPVAKAFRRWVLDVIEQYGDRVPVEQLVTISTSTITAEQQAQIHAIVDAKVGMLPKSERARAYAQIWTRFNRHFQIAKYQQLPAHLMGEAVEYLVGLKLTIEAALPSASADPFPCSVEECRRLMREIDDLYSGKRNDLEHLKERLVEVTFNVMHTMLRKYRIPFTVGGEGPGLHSTIHQCLFSMLCEGFSMRRPGLYEGFNPGWHLLGIMSQIEKGVRS